MENENTRNEIEIDLLGLFFAILNKITIIILVGVIAGAAAFGCSKFLMQPKYTATTEVYILSKQDPEQKMLTTSDLAFATYLANDYEILIVSESVLDEVKESLNLDLTTAQIASMISVELKEDTRIMDISVTSPDPQLSKDIADKVCEVANEKTKEVMDGLEAVKPVDEAKVPKNPSSPNVKKYTLLGLILGVGISVIIIAIMFVLDDTIKTPEDIERYLDVSVLASIPMKSADTVSKKKNKKKAKKKKSKKNQETK